MRRRSTARAPRALRRILHATDFSPASRPAFRMALGRLGGAGVVLAHALESLVPFEVRFAVLGHVQRGGSPTPFDRMLATRFGVAAVAALADGESGRMVALRGARIERVSLADVLSRPKRVDPQDERVAAARAIGTTFGDETGTEA